MKPFIPTTLATLLLSIPLISTPAKAQDVFSACLNSARTYNLSNDEIVIACQEATASIASCLETGWRLNLRGIELASVCRKARVNTSPCINTAWKNGLRGNQIVAVCKTGEECQCSCPSTSRYEYIQPQAYAIP